jgi:hypothetical protein
MAYLEPGAKISICGAIPERAAQLPTAHDDTHQALDALHAHQQPLECRLAAVRAGYHPHHHRYQISTKICNRHRLMVKWITRKKHEPPYYKT